MTKQLFSIFDNKKKFFLISEDELKKFHHYVFDGLSVFDDVDAKNLFLLSKIENNCFVMELPSSNSDTGGRLFHSSDWLGIKNGI